MINLTTSERTVLFLKEIDCLTQESIANKMNYSVRQVQRIQKSAERKIIDHFIAEYCAANLENDNLKH